MSYKHTIIAVAIMVLTMICLGYLSRGEAIHPNKPFSAFPKQIGEWTGAESRFDPRVYDILGVDDSFLADYRTPDGRRVQLYVGFYQSQKKGDLIHSPRHCMPGAGWRITGSSLEELSLPHGDPARIKAIKLELRKGDQRQIVLYWFQSRGRFIASEYLQKIYLVLDSITRRRTDGSFVRLIGAVRDGKEGETLKDLKQFARLVIPILQEHIPS